MSPEPNRGIMKRALLTLAPLLILSACEQPNSTAPIKEVIPEPSLVVFPGIAIFPGTAPGALLDRGNGLIYDPDLDITYYDFTFGPTVWSSVSSWAANLVVGGYSDWRLPKMKDDPANWAQTCLVKLYSDAVGRDRARA